VAWLRRLWYRPRGELGYAESGTSAGRAIGRPGHHAQSSRCKAREDDQGFDHIDAPCSGREAQIGRYALWGRGETRCRGVLVDCMGAKGASECPTSLEDDFLDYLLDRGILFCGPRANGRLGPAIPALCCAIWVTVVPKVVPKNLDGRDLQRSARGKKTVYAGMTFVVHVCKRHPCLLPG